MWSVILMPMSVWLRLPSVSISRGYGVTVAAGAAFRQDYRRPVLITGALIFTLACAATMFTTSMTQFLIARAIQGTSICFIATVGYVTVQEAFGQTKGIKLMAIITSIVLIAPIIGPLSGAALMHFVHWKVLLPSLRLWGLSHLLAYCWRCQRR